jgi:hypothetical protein
MKQAAWIAGFALLGLVGACSKQGAPAPDPAFDKQWADVSKSVPETAYIEDDRAAGLMGKVERSPQVAAEPSPAGGPLPQKLEMNDISRTIRSNLSAVKVCYLREQRVATRSGKAIVNFAVSSEGKVSDVEVNAPSFKGTNLPGCVGDQVKKMTFPKFQQGPQSVSYPFVFVGS